MAYTPFNADWKDYPNVTTPITEAALEYIEAGITATAVVADGAVPKSLVDAKGDLLAATAADTVARLGVGANDSALLAASGEATGLKWGPTWSAYVPTWTGTVNPSLGNGALSGRYTQVGKFVFFYCRLQMGSTTTYGTETWSFSLPVTAVTTNTTQRFGSAGGYDTSTTNVLVAHPYINTSTTLRLVYPATYLGALSLVGQLTPWTWATGDELYFNLFYEAA